MPLPPLLTDPYDIFAKARQRLEAARYPSRLAYDVVITVRNGGTTSTARYHSFYDSTTGAVRVMATSDEELAHPYTPRGINVYLKLFPQGDENGIPLSAPQRTFDYLGVPILAPNYTFGVAQYVPHAQAPDTTALVNEIRREFHEPPKLLPPSPAPPAGLKTIASVQSREREYVMRLVGMDDVHGHSDYHLTLQPVGNPLIYRLREVWIASSTFGLDRVVTQGNFVFGGASTVPWVSDFTQVNGAPYIAAERTERAFSDYRHHYDAASVSFTNIRPQAIPRYDAIAGFRINGETGMPPLIEPAQP